MFYNSSFDEANYYQGNRFQLGGLDRSKSLDASLIGARRSTSSVRTDEKLLEDAWRGLIRNHRIDLSGIEITVKSGVVKLWGKVSTMSEKQEAEKTVELVPGVVEIVNDLKINLNLV